jgi:hypothetical protein
LTDGLNLANQSAAKQRLRAKLLQLSAMANFPGSAMAKIGLKQAAEMTGRNQSTIHRAMKNGKLSYTVDDNGQRWIDPAELERWASQNPSRPDGSNDGAQGQSNYVQAHELRAQLELERTRVAGLQERLADKDAIVADLREDRDRWRAQAERLVLTDQREPANPPVRRWWQLRRPS